MLTDPNFVDLATAKNHLPRGKYTEVQGSGKSPYKLQHHPDGAFSCSCPAWRNQSAPGITRTCKHLKQLRGFGKEDARLNETDMDRFAKILEDIPEEVAPAVVAQPAPVIEPVLTLEEDLMPKAKTNGCDGVLLAEKWNAKVDPVGWWLSEKLDGVRAYWDGTDFFSRNGNRFDSPLWFKKLLPTDVHLDGELYAGPGKFNEAVSIVRSGTADPQRWRSLRYAMFDIPEYTAPFEQRMQALKRFENPPYVVMVGQTKCTSGAHLAAFHEAATSKGIEGTMLREPGSWYVKKRSSSLLKVKDFFDTEARIVGYKEGAGRHKGRLGAYEAQLPNGIRFDVGTGLSDRDRDHPLPIGTIIVVRYQELTPAQVPRFPSFVGVRAD
jgi:DNA ligase-1